MDTALAPEVSGGQQEERGGVFTGKLVPGINTEEWV